MPAGPDLPTDFPRPRLRSGRSDWPGELHIGGVQVARGYLNRATLTSEKFVANSFASGRLYKSGDLCRFRVDGMIEFLSRMDHQVKLRGYRIELGEIEAVLKKHPSIRDCVVMVRADGFFEFGGHPLLALEIFAQIRSKLRRALPLSALFEVPTVTGRAQALAFFSRRSDVNAA